MVTLPTQVRSIRALEGQLRSQSWGKWIAARKLAFVVEGAEVSDCTDSLVGAKMVEVTLASRLYESVDGERQNAPSGNVQGLRAETQLQQPTQEGEMKPSDAKEATGEVVENTLDGAPPQRPARLQQTARVKEMTSAEKAEMRTQGLPDALRVGYRPRLEALPLTASTWRQVREGQVRGRARDQTLPCM